MSDATSNVLLEAADGIARITLNRAEKRNALDSALIANLRDTLRRVDADGGVRVVTLTGAGKDFSAGLDLSALRRTVEAPVPENLADADALVDLFVTIRGMRKPVVALVRGRAFAGGCGLATACDLVLATDTATFAYTEIRLGFVPAIVMGILRRNVSEKRAFALAVTGEVIDAAEAERIGLINRVFAAGEFDAQAEEFVRQIATRSPSALWLTKRQIYNQDGMGFEQALRAGAAINVLARMTDDTREGIARFLAEREAKDPT